MKVTLASSSAVEDDAAAYGHRGDSHAQQAARVDRGGAHGARRRHDGGGLRGREQAQLLEAQEDQGAESLQERPRHHRRHHQGRRHHHRERAPGSRPSRRARARHPGPHRRGEQLAGSSATDRSSSSSRTTRPTRPTTSLRRSSSSRRRRSSASSSSRTSPTAARSTSTRRRSRSAGWHIGQKEWGIYPNMFSWRNSTADLTRRSTFTSRNADVMKKLGAKKIAVVGSEHGVERDLPRAGRPGGREDQGDGASSTRRPTSPPSSRTSRAIAAQIKDNGADGVYTALAGLQANGLSQALRSRRASSSRPSSSRAATTTVCSGCPATTGRTSGPSSSRSRWAHRAYEVRGCDGGGRLRAAPLLRHPGLLRGGRLRRGDQGRGRRLPDPQGVHQQPAPPEGLRRRRRVHPGRPTRRASAASSTASSTCRSRTSSSCRPSTASRSARSSSSTTGRRGSSRSAEQAKG